MVLLFLDLLVNLLTLTMYFIFCFVSLKNFIWLKLFRLFYRLWEILDRKLNVYIPLRTVKIGCLFTTWFVKISFFLLFWLNRFMLALYRLSSLFSRRSIRQKKFSCFQVCVMRVNGTYKLNLSS